MLSWDPQELAAIGLAIDLAGGYLLGRGLLSRVMDVMRRSMPFSGVNYAAVVADIRDRADALVGLTVIAIGFVIQIAALWFSATEDTARIGASEAISAVVLAALTGCCIVLLHQRLAKPWLERRMLVYAARVKPHTGVVNPDPDRDVLAALGREHGRARRVGESVDGYCERVFGIRDT